MYITCKICSFEVHANSEKEAYLKGCKKAAKFIASKKYKYISAKIERVNVKENTFLFILFTNIDLNAERKNFCKLCKEMHSQFYINEEYNCNRCNLNTFFTRVEEKAMVSKNFYKKAFKDKG